ncbi:hypothetical protein Xoosp14_22 [Xanthomonas phage Xoo-sp14]|nr:hypothetical protein Xoosp14_22 [Xanthomonas phage Xoo-sp14]
MYKKNLLTSAIENVLARQYVEHQQKLQLENVRRAAAERAAQRLQKVGGKLNYDAMPYVPATENIYEGDPDLLAQVNDIISGNLVAAALGH